MMRTSLKGAAVVIIFGAVFWLSVVVGVVWVIAHFVAKFW